MTENNYTVSFPKPYWYIAALSSDLGHKPLGIHLLEQPVVLFRDEAGNAHALLDRCAHRNVPLSCGQVVGDHLECMYHGWQFNGGGQCMKVPALLATKPAKARDVPTYAVREQQGYIWVYGEPDVQPQGEPFEFPKLNDPKYAAFRYEHVFEATLHATAENILDVPHTAFLHKGLFRGGTPNQIEVEITREADRVQAEFIGEPRPTGLAARLLAPSGGVMTHFDRFILPSIAQVEYAIGDDSHLMINNVLTPISPFETKLYAILCYRLPLGTKVIGHLLKPLAMKIVKQDADVLTVQSQALKRFGAEKFASTEVDLLGPHILRLLRSAERGDIDRSTPIQTSRVEMLS